MFVEVNGAKLYFDVEGVVDGVSGIEMAEVVLNGPQLRPLVGEVKAAGVPQHVRVNSGQPGALGRERLQPPRPWWTRPHHSPYPTRNGPW